MYKHFNTYYVPAIVDLSGLWGVITYCHCRTRSWTIAAANLHSLGLDINSKKSLKFSNSEKQCYNAFRTLDVILYFWLSYITCYMPSITRARLLPLRPFAHNIVIITTIRNIAKYCILHGSSFALYIAKQQYGIVFPKSRWYQPRF